MTMRIGLGISLARDIETVSAEVADLERAGLDVMFVPEGFSYDAISVLGYLAAKTERTQLASGVLQLYTRTPALTAMTAAGLDYLTHGRYLLGLGASSRQVIEGFHGVRYDAPIARTRELVEICRMVWRREPLLHHGDHYTTPLPADEGTGLGRVLQVVNHPVRERIPIMLAALGPKNVELAAEIAEGWQPYFVWPEMIGHIWGEALAAGTAKRDPALGELEVYASPALAIGENVDSYHDAVRSELALYLGGMGDRGKNFYHTLVTRYGYGPQADRIQALYLAGKKEEAARVVPDELVRDISLIGPAGFVRERVAAFHEAGVTVLNVTPLTDSASERVKLVERLRELI